MSRPHCESAATPNPRVCKQQKHKSHLAVAFVSFGALGRIRTHDPLVRSQVLYPTELRALKEGGII